MATISVPLINVPGALPWLRDARCLKNEGRTWASKQCVVQAFCGAGIIWNATVDQRQLMTFCGVHASQMLDERGRCLLCDLLMDSFYQGLDELIETFEHRLADLHTGPLGV